MREAVQDSRAPTVYTNHAIQMNGHVGRELSLDSPDMHLRGTEEGSKYCTIYRKTYLMLKANILCCDIFWIKVILFRHSVVIDKMGKCDSCKFLKGATDR